MIFRIFIRYILGYVNISVEGYYIERFVNICINKNIFLWNVKRKKEAFMYANVGIKDFKILREISKKTKCKIKINKKRGFPFLVNRYKKRKIFFILLIVVIFTLYVSSKFVWNIEVEGLERISEEEIIEELANNGLVIGTLKKNIDANTIINQIRLARDDIAWMSIDLSRNQCNCKNSRNYRKTRDNR